MWRRVPVATAASVTWTADDTVTGLYQSHYRKLVRTAGLLLRDVPAAEEVVQDAFVAMHGAWWRLRDPERALAYLRRTVVNRCRSALRRRGVEARYLPEPEPHVVSAEDSAISRLDRTAVVAALRRLPGRQREAVVLRYYGGLSEAEIASAMGVTKGAVKRHAARGLAALRRQLEGVCTVGERTR